MDEKASRGEEAYSGGDYERCCVTAASSPRRSWTQSAAARLPAATGSLSLRESLQVVVRLEEG